MTLSIKTQTKRLRAKAARLQMEAENYEKLARWAEIAKTVLRSRSKSIVEIAKALQNRYGTLNEMIGGNELYLEETIWYFTTPSLSSTKERKCK